MGSIENVNKADAGTGTGYRKAIHETRHVRVVCIGAGASGLLVAYKLQRSFENYSLVCYEKNADVGGTWYENRYPGCACDVPSHLYTWSFEPYTQWPAVYAGSKEIFDYFSHFCDKYNLRRFCKFKHQITGAYWREDTSEWEIEVTQLENGVVFRDRCDILINGSGVLNAWKWPDIPGLDSFKGKVMHTARWDTKYDLTGKHVGLIGNGSSAIQTLPSILPQVSKLTTFIRSPTWVAPIFGFEQHVYTPSEKEEFATDPAAHLKYRKAQDYGLVSLFPGFTKDSEVQQAVGSIMRTSMQEKLGTDELRERLIPSFPVGCRRITPGTGYLEALNSPKVQVVHGSVTAVTETGCVVTHNPSPHGNDGERKVEEIPLDVLVCATGFDTSFRPRFPIVGWGGKDMREEWKDEPRSYFGFAADGFPNYFVFLGPNSPVATGSVLQSMEIQADYMMKLINRFQTETISSFTPNTTAVSEFLDHKESIMKHMVWTSDCRSWYKNQNGTGKVIAIWPGSILHYREALEEPRYEDWDFRCDVNQSQGEAKKPNRYAYLGMGYSRTEMDPTSDWTYYITNEDESPHLSREARRRVIAKAGSVVPPEVKDTATQNGNAENGVAVNGNAH